MAEILFLDVETGGVDPNVSSILSVGAITLNGKEFYLEVNAANDSIVYDEALAVNGFKREDVILNPAKPTFIEGCRIFDKWIVENKLEQAHLCGQNIMFDHGFLKSWYNKSEMRFTFPYRTVDMHSLFVAFFGLPYLNSGLDKMCRHFGLPEEPKPHNALTGAKTARKIFLACNNARTEVETLDFTQPTFHKLC